MSDLVKISEAFDVSYGINLELVNLKQCNSTDKYAIPFVARGKRNNGVSAYVERVPDIEPNPAHTLSVAAGGSVLSTFYQPLPYYSGRDLYVLAPKKERTLVEMLFYAKCINANQYKYSYGRQANKTLRDILIPSEVPPSLEASLLSFYEKDLRSLSDKALVNQDLSLETQNWKSFELSQLFDIKKGKRLTKEEMNIGDTPYLGAIDSNNGYSERIDQAPLHPGNTITVNYDGSVGEAFYQPSPFWASDAVSILYPKFPMNQYIGMFLVSLIKAERYRFNYGLKWKLGIMNGNYTENLTTPIYRSS